MASLGPAVQLQGAPDGVAVRSVQRVAADGLGWRIVHDRRSRLRLDHVALIAKPAATTGDLTLPEEPIRSFLLAAAVRSWPVVQRKLKADAWAQALALVRTGAIAVTCQVDEGLRFGPAVSWTLLPAAAQLADRHEQARQQQRTDLGVCRTQVLRALHAELTAPQVTLSVSLHAARSLAAALQSLRAGPRLDVVLAATSDILTDRRHDGPRAFSLAHFAHSKDRDDALELLRAAGIDDQVGTYLGLSRAPRLGVAGFLDVEVRTAIGDTAVLATSAVTGPTLLRSDEAGLALRCKAEDLVLVENLQAAEALAVYARTAAHPLAVIYLAGQPGLLARQAVAGACKQARRVLLCPDADLGGVRIAAAVLEGLPCGVGERVQVCDIGAWPHQAQAPWPPDGETVRGLTAALAGPAGELAAACLTRGYRVEQEAAISTAVRDWHTGAYSQRTW